MKEDVLEQIVEDYLQFKGYFTAHNVRFRPSAEHPLFDRRQDSVYSDVDVVAVHPKKRGTDRVLVVSCKAWQVGFDATAKLAELRGEKKNPKRATEKHFRELWIPKWSEAFRSTVKDLTGAERFTYRVAVTRLKGDPDPWSTDPTIRANLPGCPVGFLTLEDMWATMLAELTTTPAVSEIGRLAQLLKAAGLTAPKQVAAPKPPTPGSDAALDDEASAGG